MKQLLIEKTHKIFIIYKHFLNLQIFINDSYNTSQKLYNLLWTWQKKLQNFYEMSYMNICSMIWRNDSQLLWYLLTSTLILNVFLKLTYLIMLRKMCSHNMIKMTCYIQLFFSHKNWMLSNQTTKSTIRNCLQ